MNRPTDGVIWAGTEVATSWNGYIEGALDVNLLYLCLFRLVYIVVVVVVVRLAKRVH